MREIEETLSRELREVADGVHVPPLPALPQEPGAQRPWWPGLAAAAAVLVVLGVVAAVAIDRGGSETEPAPPTPTSTPSETKTPEKPVKVSTDAPSIPYTLDDRLYVGGEQVPGRWWYLETSGPTWVAMNALDNTWWWGRGPEPRRIEALIESAPVLSPDGRYVAMLDAENEVLTGFDTSVSGEGLTSVPVDLGDPGLYVRAVTVDGRVIVQGIGTATLWLPFADNATVDLTETAPGQEFLADTAAGLVVSDGFDGPKYLAEISDAGELRKFSDLPDHDTIDVSPDAEWMAWTRRGSLAGEVTSIGSLEAATVDGGQRTTFTPPEGWGFKAMEWAWESDDNLVSPVLKGQTERMARCSVLTESCVLIDAP